MATLKESALAYEPPQTLNIAELDKIPVDVQTSEETHKDKDGEEFTQTVAEVEGKKYRIPASVLGGIKGILKKLPETTHVTVLKEGTGMNTRYQVLPVTAAGIQTEQVK